MSEIASTYPPVKGSDSPWGTVEDVYTVKEGITQVSTLSHGGFHVTPERMSRMPEELKGKRSYATHFEEGGNGWFEEDCEVCLVVLAFPDEFTDWQVEESKREVRFIYHLAV